MIKNRLSPGVTLIHVIARNEMNKEDKNSKKRGQKKRGQERGR
jgi:hypothetical protein